MKRNRALIGVFVTHLAVQTCTRKTARRKKIPTRTRDDVSHTQRVVKLGNNTQLVTDGTNSVSRRWLAITVGVGEMCRRRMNERDLNHQLDYLGITNHGI